jgi:hypothetical protein
MKLTCRSQKIGEVVVIRCEGRIVAGEEVHSLRLEIDKFQLETKKFILQLADVAYMDWAPSFDCWPPFDPRAGTLSSASFRRLFSRPFSPQI